MVRPPAHRTLAPLAHRTLAPLAHRTLAPLARRTLVFLIVVLLAATRPAHADEVVTLPVVVTGVGDGDTLTVQLRDGRSEVVRLIGIDAPEVDPPGQATACFAREAAAYTRAAALNRSGALELDVRERDRAGRLLGYLHLDGQRTSLNQQLLAEGYALPLSVGSNTAYSDDFRAAAKAAQLGSKGIWSACDVGSRPTIATAYPLDETPELWATDPAIRLLLGTERGGDGTVLTVTVEARAGVGLDEVVVRGDRPDDPAFSDERSVFCAGRTICSDTWTARPRGLGTYQLAARARTADGLVADAQAGLRIVGRWQMIAARASGVRARATEVRPPTPEPPATGLSETACPDGIPIKALAADANGVRRFALPTDDGYEDAIPQACFKTEAEAQAAGWSR
ncbi:MAG: thermonuclease family protein [Chloroflexi bacterium]|nr:thermonuclease family protein [Chloroflexota bacterium]